MMIFSRTEFEEAEAVEDEEEERQNSMVRGVTEGGLSHAHAWQPP